MKIEEYTLIEKTPDHLTALRHGEEWRDLAGDQLVLMMFYRLQDLNLVAAALTRGTARWEPFGTILGDPVTTGELCIDGLRHTTRLDEFGVPVLDEVTRGLLIKMNH